MVLFFLAYHTSYYFFNDKKIEYIDEISTQNFAEIKRNTKQQSSEKYYIFKNNEPSIKELEVFISKNLGKMSEEEIKMLELVRQKRISELMAKKYLTIISSNEKNENKDN